MNKLTNEDIKLILECAKERKRLRKEIAELKSEVLAEKFGVSKSAINDVISGRRDADNAAHNSTE